MLMQFYRLKTIAKILSYLFFKMVWFRTIQLFHGRAYQEQWLLDNVVGWGKVCANEVGLDCNMINTEVINEADWNRNVFLVSNHQSYMDIPAIYIATQKIFGFIAKYELSYIPFLHFWMKVQGCVFIKRSRFIQAIRVLKKLEKQGKPCRLAIFPEGTRSKNKQLGKFKTGALKIAWQLDAVMVPIIIQNTREAWEDRKKVRQTYPASIKFERPIDLREIKKAYSFKDFITAFESHFHDMYKARDEVRQVQFDGEKSGM